MSTLPLLYLIYHQYKLNDSPGDILQSFLTKYIYSLPPHSYWIIFEQHLTHGGRELVCVYVSARHSLARAFACRISA